MSQLMFCFARASGCEICLSRLLVFSPSALIIRAGMNYSIRVIFAKYKLHTTPAGRWMKAEAYNDIENISPLASQSY